jgi:hypothetical protein
MCVAQAGPLRPTLFRSSSTVFPAFVEDAAVMMMFFVAARLTAALAARASHIRIFVVLHCGVRCERSSVYSLAAALDPALLVNFFLRIALQCIL